MAGFKLCQNQIIRWSDVGYVIRRVQVNGDVLLEGLADQALLVEKREKLLAEYKSGNLSSVDSHAAPKVPVFSRPLDELSERDRKTAKKRIHYLERIFENDRPIFTSSYLKPLIQAIAAEINDPSPPSPSTIYRWYIRYRVHDDTRALIPRFDLRGSTKLKQSELVLRFVAEAIQEAFKDSRQARVGNIYTRLCGKINAENQKNPLSEPVKAPSERTLYRMCDRVEIYEMTTLREGKAAADNRFRIVKSGVKTSRILERCEADHTPLDLFIVDERTWLPLGRPTLTVIIDHFSRMLLGYFLTFEAPSTAAVIGALRHAILPKTLENSAIPNLVIHHQWSCFGLPELLVADNGLEFHGNTLEEVAFDLGIHILYCPKRQPRFKGVVERYLKTINYFFAAQLPGASYSKFYKRGDYDPQKAALLTLAEFKHIFEKWVVDDYAQSKHGGIGTTPWAAWHESFAHYEPSLPEDLRSLQQRIGLVDEVTLRKDGIVIDKIKYNSEVLAPILRAYGDSVQVRVVYDPEDLGEIQVWGPSTPDPVTVEALDLEYAKGLTVRQNKFIRQHLRERGAAAENTVELLSSRYEMALAIEDLMHGRKQKDRQRSAVLRGITSSQPSGSPSIKQIDQLIVESKNKSIVQKSKSQVSLDSEMQDKDLPPLLPTFTLKS